jgi:hypothetical protein
MRSLTRLHLALVTLALTAAFSGVAATAAAAALPPSLAGETFLQNTSDASFQFGCGRVIASTPTSYLYGGSFTFTSTGVASGPYPGTYTETGRLTAFGQSGRTFPTRQAQGRVTSLHATFTITAADGSTVSGSKILDLTMPAACLFYPGPGGEFWSDNASVRYDALITTASGAYRDSGDAVATLDGSISSGGVVSTFSEQFTTSRGLLSGG